VSAGNRRFQARVVLDGLACQAPWQRAAACCVNGGEAPVAAGVELDGSSRLPFFGCSIPRDPVVAAAAWEQSIQRGWEERKHRQRSVGVVPVSRRIAIAAAPCDVDSDLRSGTIVFEEGPNQRF